jgi:transcriptional regulator with XRE-family HTH domain
MKLGDRLKLLRNKLKLSQKEMAQKIGIATSTYQNYERNERKAPETFIVDTSTAFEVSMVWLLTGEGEMFARPQVQEAVSEGLEPRLAAIVGLLADMPEEQVDEVYKYISKEKRLAELEKAVEELKAKAG